MSPASRSASAMSRMTRARPSMVPAETGRPTSAPAGKSSRRDDPAMPPPPPPRHPRRSRAPPPPRLVFARLNAPVVPLARAHDLLDLLEPEIEDVFLLTKHAGLDETPGFFQQ